MIVDTISSEYPITAPSGTWNSGKSRSTRADVFTNLAINQESPVTPQSLQQDHTSQQGANIPEESKGNFLFEIGKKLGVLQFSDDRSDNRARQETRHKPKSETIPTLAAVPRRPRYETPRSTTTVTRRSRGKGQQKHVDDGYTEPRIPGLPEDQQPIIRRSDMVSYHCLFYLCSRRLC